MLSHNVTSQDKYVRTTTFASKFLQTFCIVKWSAFIGNTYVFEIEKAISDILGPVV